MNDTVELAKRYVTGLTLKRGDTMEMVKELLEMLEKRTMKFVGAPTVEKETALGSQILVYPLTEDGKRALTIDPSYALMAPDGVGLNVQNSSVIAFLVSEFEKDAPHLHVTVSRTAEGAVFVGPDVNRTYSAAEARALAGKLYREASKV